MTSASKTLTHESVSVSQHIYNWYHFHCYSINVREKEKLNGV